MKKFLLYLAMIVFFSSCKDREWNNPFDPDCPKDIFTPTNFTAVQQGTGIKLNWVKKNSYISGFTVYKNSNDGTWTTLNSLGNNITTYTDNAISGGAKYEYKLYATAGSNQSNEAIAYCTPVLGAVLTTTAAFAVTSTTASTGGTISSDGGSPVTAHGVCYGTAQNPDITGNKITSGMGTGSFIALLSGLLPGTIYNVRAYATNSFGIVYGNQISFKTNVVFSLPTVITHAATDITSSSAFIRGNIKFDGNTTIIEKGICFSSKTNPTTDNKTIKVSNGFEEFSDTIKGLVANTTYYARAYAINSQGTAYGDQVSFRTLFSNGIIGTVNDIEGNVYVTVTIGNQEWMTENLLTSKYNDRTEIAYITDKTTWSNLTTGAICFYNNDIGNKAIYGALYNWYAVNTGKLCPIGWHVPTDEEWMTMIDYLGGNTIAGNKMRSEIGWDHFYTNTTNSSGFSGFAGGVRYNTGGFGNLENSGSWWTYTEMSSTHAWYIGLFDKADLYNSYKTSGLSIRCMKNNT